MKNQPTNHIDKVIEVQSLKGRLRQALGDGQLVKNSKDLETLTRALSQGDAQTLTQAVHDYLAFSEALSHGAS